MKYCDGNPSILEWGSEEIVIPYRSPLDNRIHRYFVDFYIKVKDVDGNIQKYLIEVKPKKQTREPKGRPKGGPGSLRDGPGGSLRDGPGGGPGGLRPPRPPQAFL